MLGKKYLILSLILGSFSTATLAFTFKNPTKLEARIVEKSTESEEFKLYQEIGLTDLVSFDVFKTALNGYSKINDKKKNFLTIIDYSKPSTEQRFFIIDVSKKKILISSHVSHGKNSGSNIATSFSNRINSNKSSLGFFLTENTYMGGNGYSLILNGLEKNINDNAKKRYIVIHGADYANPKITKSQGRLGRSLGCPALPKDISKQAIDLIKNGSVIYVHGNDPLYIKESMFV